MKLTVHTATLHMRIGGSGVTSIGPRGQSVVMRVHQTPIKLSLGHPSAVVISVGVPGLAGPVGDTGVAGLPGQPGPPGIDFTSDLDADCLSTDSVLDYVYVTGDAVLGKIQVAMVDIDDLGKMPAIGVIVSKVTPLGTECVVRRIGDIITSGLTPNLVYWIDTNARAVNPRPSDPVAGVRVLQIAGRALTNTTLQVTVNSDIRKVIP